MNHIILTECVNPTYQESEDNDSHHYIEPMEWLPGPNHTDDQAENRYSSYAGEYQDDQSSSNLRQRLQPQHSRSSEKVTNIRDELPSRNIDLGQSDTDSEEGGATAKRHNSNLSNLRFRSAAVRQMDQNALFDLLNSDPDATSEEVRETLRSVNQSLTMKRQVKARLSKTEEQQARHKHKTVSFTKRLKYNLAMSWQHLQQELWTLYQSIDLWHSHLKAVQGHFGSGVASYFYFLRRLFFLNLLACLFIICFVVVPQAVYDTKQQHLQQTTQTTVSFKGSELLTGDGYFRDTLLYYGHYTNETLAGYQIPEAYFFTYAAYTIFCIFVLTYSVAKTYRLNYIETAGELKNVFAPKLLAAWDYTIERESSARLKSRSIYNELKELIASRGQEKESVDLGKRLFVYLWRVIINLLILAGMVATGYLVNWLLRKALIQVDVPVLKEITVALVVTSILFVVPFIFSLMSNWESYASKQTQIYLNIVRVVILRTVILGVVVSFWLTEPPKVNALPAENDQTTVAAVSTLSTVSPDSETSTEICWETRLGQEMYRLIIVDFLCVLLLPTFVIEFLRHIFYEHCSKWVGNPEFDIAQNTLDLVYTQMLVWVGFFYSPLLPLIAVIKLFVIFYVKRLSVVQNCSPPRKAWRAAHAQTLFLTLTFVCFMLSLLALGYSILEISPSKTCGPFRNLTTVYSMVVDQIDTSEDSNKILNKLLSPGVVAGLMLFLCVIVYYKRATAKAHMDMVKLLREQLTLEGKDKVFLLRLFENAMHQQDVIAHMKRNVLKRDNSVPPDSARNNLTRAQVESSPAPNTYYNGPNVNPMERQGWPNSEDLTRRDRLGELQREENFGSRSTSREPSPYYSQENNHNSEGHRFNARDSPPYIQTRDGSPSSGPSRYGAGDSPQGSMDRRVSQASHNKVNQVPLFMKPTHQHGFRQLTPGPQGSSRQSTPQRSLY